MKITTLLLCLSLLTVSVPFTLAQNKSATTFKVNTLVSDGKKSKEVDSALMFEETSFKAENRKTAAESKNSIMPILKPLIILIRKNRFYPPAVQLPQLFFSVFYRSRFCL